MIWVVLGGAPCQGLFLRSNEDQILVPSLLTSASGPNPAPYAPLLAFLLHLDFTLICNLWV